MSITEPSAGDDVVVIDEFGRIWFRRGTRPIWWCREALSFESGRPWADIPSPTVYTPRTYNREILVDVIIHHARTSIEGCHCGWAVLGASHAEHVADVYEQAVAKEAS